jgi:hypothetical protein
LVETKSTAPSKARSFRFYRKAIKAAKEANTSQAEIDTVSYELMMEVDTIDDEIQQLVSQRVTQLAEDSLIPIPEIKQKDGAWEQSQTGKWRLTREAINTLRSEVRKEQRERSEGWRTSLAAWTGVIGALIGLASIFLNKH